MIGTIIKRIFEKRKLHDDMKVTIGLIKQLTAPIYWVYIK